HSRTRCWAAPPRRSWRPSCLMVPTSAVCCPWRRHRRLHSPWPACSSRFAGATSRPVLWRAPWPLPPVPSLRPVLWPPPRLLLVPEPSLALAPWPRRLPRLSPWLALPSARPAAAPTAVRAFPRPVFSAVRAFAAPATAVVRVSPSPAPSSVAPARYRHRAARARGVAPGSVQERAWGAARAEAAWDGASARAVAPLAARPAAARTTKARRRPPHLLRRASSARPRSAPATAADAPGSPARSRAATHAALAVRIQGVRLRRRSWHQWGFNAAPVAPTGRPA